MRCDCRKIIYASRRAALAAARSTGQRVYRCPSGCWHTTRQGRVPKTRRVQLAREDTR